MKLSEKYSTFSKEDVYKKYLSIVYGPKKYSDITKKQMLKDIVKEYEQEDYLYYMCIKKELKVLSKIVNNKLNEEDITKYDWEINALAQKLIIDETTLEVYEELTSVVSAALNKFKKEGAFKSEKVIITFIGFIRTYGAVNEAEFMDIACGITHLDEEDIYSLLGSPLFHFYCMPFSNTIDNTRPILLYREYSDYLDIFLDYSLDLTFRILPTFDYKYFESMFYYGLPTSIKIVDKVYQTVLNSEAPATTLLAIECARLFDYREPLSICIKDEEFQALVDRALRECPPPLYERFEEVDEEMQQHLDDVVSTSLFGDSRFPLEPDENSHLSKKDFDLYDKLYTSLLEYANNKYKLTSSKKVYKNKKINVGDFYRIESYFWNNLHIIDEFIEENVYNFSESELELVKGFKKTVNEDYLIIVGFTEDYIEILSNEGKLYMVKSPRPNYSDIFYDQNLPIWAQAKLTEFKGNIVIATFFKTKSYKDKNEIEEILEKKKNAIKYYHL